MLPRAAIEKLLREAVGAQELALPKETVEWVAESAEEFLRRLSNESNAIAEEQAAKESYRISPEHVLRALTALGHDEFTTAVRQDQAELLQAVEKKKAQASRKKATEGLTEEELLAEQNALLASAHRKAAQDGW